MIKKFGYRKVTYKDIVILLRASANSAPVFEKEIYSLGFPVFSDTTEGYLDTIEIQTILSVLKIIDNPIQDIELVTTLRSPMFRFTDNELIEIRLVDKNCSFYDSLKKATIQVNDELKEKINYFFNTINNWRDKQEYFSLDELIWKIYIDSGYYNYVSLMPNGNLRQANLKMLFEKAKEYENSSFKGLFNFIRFIDKLKNKNGDLGSAKLIGENENVIRIMSIHKSKGLEFPIVFLSNTGKKINMQDLKQKVLLHQELGIGPKYINYERKIEYNTLAKEAIKLKTEMEILSEEMRILYVALTRGKEKIIITGTTNNLTKDIEQKKENLQIYNNTLQPSLIKKYISYLDWLELIILNNQKEIEKILTVNYIKQKEIMKKTEKVTTIKREITQIKTNNTNLEKIQEKLNWKYKNIEATKIPSKLSVTKIKEIMNVEVTNDKPETNNKVIPKILESSKKISGAEKGTLIHKIMQKMNFEENYTKQELEDFIKELLKKEELPENTMSINDINKIISFTESGLYQKLQKAIKIKKETPFYINIKAKEIYDNNIDDEILVQGIIDLYFIDENNKIILVDYKTDFANKEELISKYKEQLEIYKIALEKALKQKVEHVYIYSTYLEKEIEVK